MQMVSVNTVLRGQRLVESAVVEPQIRRMAVGRELPWIWGS